MTGDVPIIYLDDRVAAADKPPRLTVVPAAGDPGRDCLRFRLESQLGAKLWVVHRLDRDTSGIVLFARDAETHRALGAAFEARRVHKTYLAFTSGAPPDREGLIDTPLHPARRGKARPARPREAGASSALTGYAVKRRWHRGAERVALVEARPETGRHHQVRVHLRSIGAPVLFDPLYGGGPAGRLLGAPANRLALHASRLAVPGAGPADEPLVLESPLPGDLASLLQWLDGTWEHDGAG